MKGARINFGVPNSEYVLLADDDGVAVSLKNQDTDTEYIGGGGGSDFSTAEVTIVCAETMTAFYGYEVYDEEGAAGIASYNNAYEGTSTIYVPLYKGLAIWDLIAAVANRITASGNITKDGSSLIITGDGTITIS